MMNANGGMKEISMKSLWTSQTKETFWAKDTPSNLST